MGKLVLDIIGTDMQDFIEDGPCHCPEAVAGHGVLVITRVPQCRIDGVFRHGPGMGAHGREDITACPGIFMQFLQYPYRLIAKGYDVGLFHLHLVRRKVPYGVIEIDLRPLCMPEFSRTNE